MTTPDHDHAACLHAKEEAAVALLRRRDPSPEVRAHLDACPPCRDEYQELSSLPGLLGITRDTLAATPVEPPRPQLLDRLLDEVNRGRRRRRRLTAGLLAAAAVLAVIAGLSIEARSARSPGIATAAVVVASGTGRDVASGADARIDVRAEGGGSAVSVSVHGWPQGKPCRMRVHDTGGAVRDVGIWNVDAHDTSTYVEDVDLPPARIERVELVDDRTGRAMIDILVRGA